MTENSSQIDTSPSKDRSRNSGLRRFLVILSIPLAIYGLYKLAYPTYEWNQKLRIVVETPSGEVTGSGVIEVRIVDEPNLLPDGGGWDFSFRGEATAVDLGDDKWLFALVQESNIWSIGQASFLDYDKQYYRSGLPHFAKHIESWPDRVPVRDDYYPLLVTFEEINDPSSVKEVNPDDIAESFGPGYSLREMTLEITDEPVTDGRIEEILGWWCELRKQRARLNGSTSIAISSSDLSDNLGTGVFRIGGCT